MTSDNRIASSARRLWAILGPSHRRGAIVLFGLSLIGMVMETLGVGLVIPAFSVMTEANPAVSHPMLRPVLEALGMPSRERLVVIGMFVLAGIYVVKAVFLAFLTWRQMHFVYAVLADVSQRLYAGYLRLPYVFHLQRNSAELIRNALNETSLFSQYMLVAALTLLTESLVVVGVSILMLAVEPVGTVLLTGAIGLVAWLFHRYTSRRTAVWGAARQVHEGKRIQHLQQGLGGVKEIKLLGREESFLGEFSEHNRGYAYVSTWNATLFQLPRMVLEPLAVLALAALVLIMLWRGRPMDALVPMLGLFGVSAFRLIPSANRILQSVQNFRYGMPAIDTLFTELQSIEQAGSAPRSAGGLPFEGSIQLDHVTFQYPNTESPTLRDVSLSIAKGASVGFVGPTGGGKSTLVDVILGLLVPRSGTVAVDGTDIHTRLGSWQTQIGYVPQTIFLTDDSLRRNIAFGVPVDEIDDAAVRQAARDAQLEAFIDSLPDGFDTMVGERGVRLSGGQRQRIGVARALYPNPSVLVLDEATSALDIDTEREVMDTVRSLRGSKTIIIIAHRLSTVEHCDRLFRLENGAVVDAVAALSLP